jgi:hypothetical protein
MGVENELKTAISLAESGQKTEALSILAKIVQDEPRNDQIWLWIAQCVTSREQMAFALKKVVQLNPSNLVAAWKLEQLEADPSFEPQPGWLDDTRPLKRLRQKPVAAAPASSDASAAPATPESSEAPVPASGRRWRTILLVVLGISILLMIVVMVAFVIFRTNTLNLLASFGIILP